MKDGFGAGLVPLLSATMRIADIHDSGHEPGASVTSLSEDRGKNSKGLWLEIAARLLHYLHEEDINANEGWVILEPFSENIEGLFNIEANDIQYVINYLSTPTRISTCTITDSKIIPTSTKNTALIERPNGKNTNRARLTEVGRRTIVLSQTAQKWLYAHHDTDKILSAIDLKDFSSIPQLCLSLSQSIRSFTHQIRRVMERPGVDEVVSAFKEDSVKYKNTIKMVQEGVDTAAKRLSERDIQESLEAWMEQNPESNIDANYLFCSLDELMQSVEGLHRVFNKFIAMVLDNNREIVGCIRFDKAALKLACTPASQQNENDAFNYTGPWVNTLSFISPDDFVGCIKVRKKKEKLPPVIFDSETKMSIPAPIYRFMEKYRDEIIKHLEQGPISISDAINQGWAEIDDELFTGQLVGVFSSPGWLNMPNSKINLSIKKGRLKVPLSNGNILLGDDLIISLEDD